MLATWLPPQGPPQSALPAQVCLEPTFQQATKPQWVPTSPLSTLLLASTGTSILSQCRHIQIVNQWQLLHHEKRPTSKFHSFHRIHHHLSYRLSTSDCYGTLSMLLLYLQPMLSLLLQKRQKRRVFKIRFTVSSIRSEFLFDLRGDSLRGGAYKCCSHPLRIQEDHLRCCHRHWRPHERQRDNNRRVLHGNQPNSCVALRTENEFDQYWQQYHAIVRYEPLDCGQPGSEPGKNRQRQRGADLQQRRSRKSFGFELQHSHRHDYLDRQHKFYVYRHFRQFQHHDWLGLRRLHFHPRVLASSQRSSKHLQRF